MKALIFCLRNQIKVADEIATLLREHVFENMTIDVFPISNDYNMHSGEQEHMYFRMFF